MGSEICGSKAVRRSRFSSSVDCSMFLDPVQGRCYLCPAFPSRTRCGDSSLPGFLLHRAPQDSGLEASGQWPSLIQPQWDDTEVLPRRDISRTESQVPTAATCSGVHPSLVFLHSPSHFLLSSPFASWDHLPNKPPASKSQGLFRRTYTEPLPRLTSYLIIL